ALALGWEHRIPGSARRVAGVEKDGLITAIMLQDLALADSSARHLHRMARGALEASGWPSGFQGRLSTWYLTLAATAYAAAGDTAIVRRLADSVQMLARRSTYGRDLQLHHFLRGLVLQRRGMHEAAIEQLRRSLYSLTDGYTRTSLALARSLLERRLPAEAIALLRPAIHGGVDGSNSYTSRTELHEALAQAFEQAGQRDSAVAHYAVVEQNWRRADPEFRDRYLRARLKTGR
ncbi:MAG: hypothetical protein ACRENB_14440, partial [Gemmatimonadales bacterium]